MSANTHRTVGFRRADVGLLVCGLLLLAGMPLLMQVLPLSPQALWQSLGVYLLMVLWVATQIGRHGLRADFGSANRATLLRGALVAGFAGLVGHTAAVEAAGWWLIAAALLVLLLDGVDGYLARRDACASGFGARFDMELDAFFILLLSILAFQLGRAGIWVLLLGLMRYIFMLSAWVVPKLRAELPPSQRRKTVCVLQVVGLGVALMPPVPPAMAAGILAAALLALAYSFGVDVRWLLRRNPLQNVT